MKRLRRSEGLTLLEILIVLVVLAVVAGLALPAYTTTVEKSRSQEALRNLANVRESMIRFHSANNTYSGASFAGISALDFNPNNAGTTGQNLHFSYTIGGLGQATFTITALRNSADGGDGTSTVTLNHVGAVNKTGVYAA